jgi:dolichol-phosphate mannosyltransferase
MSNNRCLVVIPTYNERANIEQLIPEVLRQDARIDILVVDDGSPDGTGDYVEQLSGKDPRVFAVHQREKGGLGKAYQTGYRYALEKDYRYALGMDADFSHDPDDIPRFLDAIKSADYVIGSRWVPGGGLVNWPWHRVLLSRMAGYYVYFLHGTGIHDSTSGFQCFKKEVLAAIELEKMHSDGYSFQLEAKYRAYNAGATLLEIPILFKDRTRGTSKIPRRTILETLWVTLLLKIQHARFTRIKIRRSS